MLYSGVVLSIILLSISLYVVERYKAPPKIKIEVVETTIYRDTCVHGIIENIDYRSIQRR